MNKKFLLLLTCTLTALPAFAELGDTVGDFKGGDAADFGKRFRNPTADVNWKVGPAGLGRTDPKNLNDFSALEKLSDLLHALLPTYRPPAHPSANAVNVRA